MSAALILLSMKWRVWKGRSGEGETSRCDYPMTLPVFTLVNQYTHLG